MAEDKVKLEIEVPKESLLKVAKKQIESKDESKEESKKESDGVAGYEPAEILKAPLTAPEPADKAPPNEHQRRVMLLGFGFILISFFLLAFINLTAFIIMLLAGAGIIAFGVLVRV